MIKRIIIAWHSRKLKKLSKDFHYYLSKYSDYYNNLNPQLQTNFRERTFLSMQFIEFKPVQFNLVTEEMKILITSALVQITFGLENFILERFKTIMVVPNTYSFQQYDALLGHVDHNENLIALSWPSVKKGFIIPDDAFNVALHELAHALQSENYSGLFYNKFFDEVSMRKFLVEGYKKMMKIQERRQNYLRNYAGQNMMELFAVSIESFFEQPDKFKSMVPKLYDIISKMLRQDPTLKGNPLLERKVN